MFQSKILECGNIGKTHKPCGLSALNFKPLKPYCFKVFTNFSRTLRSQTIKLLYIIHTHIHVCMCVCVYVYDALNCRSLQ